MSEWMQTRNACPHCGRPGIGYEGVNTERAPIVDDFVVCSKCGGLSVVQDDLTLRVATDAEREEFVLLLGDADAH